MNLTERREKIESGIPGIELCPKCGGMTCFVLPNYHLGDETVTDYCCPRCLRKSYIERDEDKI